MRSLLPQWNQKEAPPLIEDFSQYSKFPLLHSMLQHENERTNQLKEEGKHQMLFPKSNAGWFRTVFNVRGRALDKILLPWVLIVLHVIVYTTIQEVAFKIVRRDMKNWEIFFALVLNTTLSFLLVFRLNRAAGRYWTSRELWGMIVAKGRCFLGTAITHGDHDPTNRDDAIRWVVAFHVATTDLLRGMDKIPAKSLKGVLTGAEVDAMNKNGHAAIYAIDKARHHVAQLFRVDETSQSKAILYSSLVALLEEQCNVMLECCGGMERIRSTPLPMVYVSHLRTFLLMALFMLPYVWGPSWGWTTIPIVACTAYAWLGIEGAAAEAECPFRADRVNALDMSGYCLGFISVVKQQLLNDADSKLATTA